MRYVKMNDDWMEAKAGDYLPRTIHESGPFDTGLLDQDGKKIFKVMDRVGFVTSVWSKS